jgi:hypothetical protein
LSCRTCDRPIRTTGGKLRGGRTALANGSSQLYRYIERYRPQTEGNWARSKRRKLSKDVSKTANNSKQLVRKFGALGASILLVLGLESCSAEQKELDRRSSPNHKIVAVLMESLLKDAAGSVQENIYMNDQGLPLNLDKPVFSAVGCDHVSFEWLNDYTLQVHYETVCVINQFTNRWSRPSDVAVGRPNPIEIILIRK